MSDDKAFEVAGRTITKQGQRIAELESQLIVARNLVDTGNSRIEALAVEIAGLRADAERYRWLRLKVWVSSQDVQMNGRTTKYARIGMTFRVSSEQAGLPEPELFDICVDAMKEAR